MDIGMVGIGKMGGAIARRLLEAGHQVTVYDRSPGTARSLLALGAKLAASPSEAAQGDVLISMLPNDEGVERVTLGTLEHEGLLSRQAAHTTHVSMNTISIALSKRMTEASAQRQRRFIAAPAMGRPHMAEEGVLVIMAAGEQSLIDSCIPIIDILGRATYTVGARPEQANLAKITLNFMLGNMIEAHSEAFAMIRKNGLDLAIFLQIVASDFFRSPVYEHYGKIMLDKDFEAAAFTAILMEKDMRLALEAAIGSQAPMPSLPVIENASLSAIARGKDHLDLASSPKSPQKMPA